MQILTWLNEGRDLNLAFTRAACKCWRDVYQPAMDVCETKEEELQTMKAKMGKSEFRGDGNYFLLCADY